MSIISAPGTRSPGKVAIVYHYPNIEHQVSVNLIDGVDINDLSTLQIDADHLADELELIMPPSATWSAWRLLSPTGQVLYRAALSNSHVGTHATDPGMIAYYSPTIKIMGRGAPTSVLQGSGTTYFEVFTRNAFRFDIGQTNINTVDANLAAFMADLNAYLRYWADFYGQHADTTGDVFCQFNAHEQKRNGS